MTTTRQTIKIVRQGERQTIQLPPEFEFDDEELVLYKDGDTIVIRTLKSLSLIEYLDTLEPLEEEFPEVEDLPIDDVDI
jgi:antitoxin VapB